MADKKNKAAVADDELDDALEADDPMPIDESDDELDDGADDGEVLEEDEPKPARKRATAKRAAVRAASTNGVRAQGLTPKPADLGVGTKLVHTTFGKVTARATIVRGKEGIAVKVVGGDTFKSLSAAAKSVSGREEQGGRFWTREGDEHPLIGPLAKDGAKSSAKRAPRKAATKKAAAKKAASKRGVTAKRTARKAAPKRGVARKGARKGARKAKRGARARRR